MKRFLRLFGLSLTLVGLLSHSVAGEETATILSQGTVCKQAGRYIGWPTITRTRDGELLVVFSGDRDAHICPWGKTQMVRSRDDGRTWSEPETINNSPLDDRDAGIIQTKSGALLVSWFTSTAFMYPEKLKWQNLPPELLASWQRHIAKISPETIVADHGNWTRRSVDGGKSWERPVKTIGSAPHGPIQLQDGRLLYVGLSTHEKVLKLGVEESRDDGRSWQYLAEIPVAEEDQRDPDWRLRMQDEPHVVELPDGKLVAMIRAEPRDHSQTYLRQTESEDGGKTWTTTHQTAIYGYPPHLLRLKNGWLLVVYGVRREPFGEHACLSKDGGKTWDVEHEITLRPAPNSDLGYPSSVQLEDGSIFTVYYQIDQTGEKTSLLSTHWRLKE